PTRRSAYRKSRKTAPDGIRRTAATGVVAPARPNHRVTAMAKKQRSTQQQQPKSEASPYANLDPDARLSCAHEMATELAAQHGRLYAMVSLLRDHVAEHVANEEDSPFS